MAATDRASMPTGQGFQYVLQRLRRGGLWIVCGRSIGLGVVFGVHALLAHLLSVEEFAAFVLASSLVITASMASMMGLNTLVCRSVAAGIGVGRPAHARRAVRLMLSLGAKAACVAALIWWLASGWLARGVFDMPLLDEAAGFIALWIALLAISQILAEALRGLHDLRAASLLAGVSGGLVSNLILLVAVAVLYCFIPVSFRAVTMLAVFSFVAPIGLSLVWLRRGWRDESYAAAVPDASLPELGVPNVLREAVPIMLLNLASLGLNQLDVWIVGGFCSTEDLAVYGAVRRVAFLGFIPFTLVTLAIMSSIAELHARGDRKQLEWLLQASATVSAVAALIALFVLTMFASPILRVLFGPLYRAGAVPVAILCIGQFVKSCTGPTYQSLLMSGHQRTALLCLLGAAPILLLGPWAATAYGLSGLAFVVALMGIVSHVFQWIAVRSKLGVWSHASPTFAVGLVTALTGRTGRAPIGSEV